MFFSKIYNFTTISGRTLILIQQAKQSVLGHFMDVFD